MNIKVYQITEIMCIRKHIKLKYVKGIISKWNAHLNLINKV